MKNNLAKTRKKFWELKIPKIIKKNLKAGLVPIVVIILGILIGALAIKMLSGLVDPIYRLFNQHLPGSKNSTLDNIYLYMFGLLTTFLIWLGLGVIINALKNKRGRIVKIFSSLIIKSPFLKNLLMPEEILKENNGSTKEKQETEKEVIVVRFKTVFGLDALGFVTNRIKSYSFDKKKWVDEFVVEVPNSPMPWSGYTHFIEVKDAKEIWVVTTDEKTGIKKTKKMTKAEAAKAIISCGLSMPSTLICSPVNTPATKIQKILSEFEQKSQTK